MENNKNKSVYLSDWRDNTQYQMTKKFEYSCLIKHKIHINREIFKHESF